MNALSPLAQFTGAQEILDAFFEGAKLDPPMTAAEFGKEHVVLSAGMASEVGRYDPERTPYLIELLTNLSSMSSVVSTILMKGSQIGASQAGLVFLLYVVAIAGGPCLVVCPTTGMAELYSKQRLEPLIRDCEPAAKKLPSNKGSESGNTILLKTFPGGILRLVGAGAVNPLKSMPAKVVVFEEPDEYERDLEGQGDATKIVLRRITTFGRRAKVFMNCTPGLQSRSIILPAYLSGDQREYRMPCPHCGHMTVFNKDLFRFTKSQPETAHMVCEDVTCGKPILEGRHKTAMMAYGSGQWIPRVKDAPADMPRSYYLPAFYSPVGWESWAAIAKDIEAAEGNYELSKTLWNQTFGLPWCDVTDRPDHEALFQRAKASPYRMREIPAGVVFLCAGIDVGIDHIEIGVWGFGRKGRRYLIEHVRIRGSKSDPETWAQAEVFLMRRYMHPSGAILQIRRAGADRGKWPEVVVPWVRKQDPDFIVAVRGNEKVDAQILKESFWRERTDDGRWSKDGGFKYWTLGVGMLKLELYTYLNVPPPREDEEPPPGYVFLPNDVTPEWCQQLVSEEYAEHKVKRTGKTSMSWHKVGGVRGEALDTANYARAMAELVGWAHWSEADFVREEMALAAHAEDLRGLMAKEQLARLRAGDHRPVIMDDLVSNIVRPDDFERPEGEPLIALPASTPPPRPVSVGEASRSGINVPRGLSSNLVPDGAVERPSEVGVAGKASARVDMRSLMRGAGVGRSRNQDYD